MSDRLQELEERWKADPSSRIFLQLAKEHLRLEAPEEAASVLERGLEHHPESIAAWVALGRCRVELGDYEQAVAALEPVVERDPAQLVAYRLLIESHLELGDGARADQLLAVYRDLQPDDPKLGELAERLAELDAGGESGSSENPTLIVATPAVLTGSEGSSDPEGPPDDGSLPPIPTVGGSEPTPKPPDAASLPSSVETSSTLSSAESPTEQQRGDIATPDRSTSGGSVVEAAGPEPTEPTVRASSEPISSSSSPTLHEPQQPDSMTPDRESAQHAAAAIPTPERVDSHPPDTETETRASAPSPPDTGSREEVSVPPPQLGGPSDGVADSKGGATGEPSDWRTADVELFPIGLSPDDPEPELRLSLRAGPPRPLRPRPLRRDAQGGVDESPSVPAEERTPALEGAEASPIASVFPSTRDAGQSADSTTEQGSPPSDFEISNGGPTVEEVPSAGSTGTTTRPPVAELPTLERVARLDDPQAAAGKVTLRELIPEPPPDAGEAEAPAAEPRMSESSEGTTEGTTEAPLAVPGDRKEKATTTLGRLYLEQGHPEEAARIFEEVLETDPENAEALRGLQALRQRGGEVSAAQLLARYDGTPAGGLSEKKSYVLRAYLDQIRGASSEDTPAPSSSIDDVS